MTLTTQSLPFTHWEFLIAIFCGALLLFVAAWLFMKGANQSQRFQEDIELLLRKPCPEYKDFLDQEVSRIIAEETNPNQIKT